MTLSIDDLSFSYGELAVLENVSFEVVTGTVTALFGPNGAGKSTLFRCVLGMLQHTGTVSLDGANTRGWSAQRMARHVAFVPQDHKAAFPHTVRDMVTMGTTAAGASLFGPSRSDVRTAVQELDRLDLLPLAERSFSSLSGGQRQLVLIARALAQNTPYLLLDEPTASLDFGNQKLIWDTVRDLAHDQGKGVLVCSHDPNHVLWFCDSATLLRRNGTATREAPVREAISEDAMRELYPGQATLADVSGTSIVIPNRTVRAEASVEAPLQAGRR